MSRYPPIESILPHRPPFLMVDRILEVADRRIVAARTFHPDESFFKGHFPGNPVVPGVLLVEGLAQAMAYLALLSRSGTTGTGSAGLFLVGIDRTRFRSSVAPGEEAIYEVTLPRAVEAGGERFGLLKGEGLVRVGERRVAEAQLSGYSGEPGKALG